MKKSTIFILAGLLGLLFVAWRMLKGDNLLVNFPIWLGQANRGGAVDTASDLPGADLGTVDGTTSAANTTASAYPISGAQIVDPNRASNVVDINARMMTGDASLTDAIAASAAALQTMGQPAS